MARYQVIFEGEEEGEPYDTYEEAEEAALNMCSEMRTGRGDLAANNPYEYSYDEDEEYEYEIVDRFLCKLV